MEPRDEQTRTEDDRMNTGLIIVLVITALAALAVLPTVIGLARDVDDKGLLVFCNVLGVITVAGWIGAIILACCMPKRDRRPPLYVIPPADDMSWLDELPDGAERWSAAS